MMLERRAEGGSGCSSSIHRSAYVCPLAMIHGAAFLKKIVVYACNESANHFFSTDRVVRHRSVCLFHLETAILSENGGSWQLIHVSFSKTVSFRFSE